MYSPIISTTENMKKTFVIKRNGKQEEISFDKINIRIKSLCDGLEVDPIPVAQKVISQIYDRVPTSELDELAGRACASLETSHPDYGELAKRIIISNNHKTTSPSFSETINQLYHHIKNDKHSPIVSKELYDVVMANKEKLNTVIDYQRDYNFDYFSFKTLEKAYLKKINGKVIERIQHLIMRVSLGLHLEDLKSALRSYEYMSQKYVTQATPTLFHSGTPRPQLSSCFLLSGSSDSIDGIYKTVSDCAKISKWAGGIGLHVSGIRSRGTYIRGTDGKSDGIVPMLKVYNDTAKYVNQCFTPDTIVFTKEEGVMRMDKLKEGNEMVTKDGSYKKINKVFIRELAQPEEMICYQSVGSPEPVKCTKQHEIYCLDKNSFNIGDTFVNVKAGVIRGVFKAAGELKTGDYIGFPIPQYTLDYLEESPEFYYLYGTLLNYGRIETSYDYKLTPLTKYYISLDPSYDDHQLKLKKIKKILDTADIKYKNYLEDNKLVIYWKRFTYQADIKYDLLYDSNGIKRIHPTLMHLPIEKLKRLISGLLDNTFQIKTTSPQLAHGIRYLFLRMGVLVGGQSLMALENDKIYRDFNQATDRIYTLEIPADQSLE